MSWSLFGQYLNAPVNKLISNRFLIDAISIIGKKYGSKKEKASNFAKGNRYLKSQIQNCKTDHIKQMLYPELHRIPDKNDDEFVFRFSIYTYVEIFAKIVEIMNSNHALFSDDIKKEYSFIKTVVLEPKYTYSELLIREPLISLKMVCLHGIPVEHRKIAQTILDGIDSIDKKYNLRALMS